MTPNEYLENITLGDNDKEISVSEAKHLISLTKRYMANVIANKIYFGESQHRDYGVIINEVLTFCNTIIEKKRI